MVRIKELQEYLVSTGHSLHIKPFSHILNKTGLWDYVVIWKLKDGKMDGMW